MGRSIIYIYESKAISVTDRGGLRGCEMLRIPHCVDNQFGDGGEVSLKHRPRSTHQKICYFCLRYSFLLEDE
jgi:hypothetical protein